MVVESPPKPKHATWLDWLPPDAPEPTDLLTREDVLDRLRQRREDVTERELRRWEYEGVLPRPVRRGRTGVAHYPEWYVPLARHVRRLRRLDFSLDQIRRRSRAYARYVLEVNDDPDNPIDTEIQEHKNGQVIEGPEDVSLSAEAKGELVRLAGWHERITGVPTDHVQVWVVDAEGNSTGYPVPVADVVRWAPAAPPRLTGIDHIDGSN